MTKNEVLAWLEREGIKTHSTPLYYAYDYLKGYYKEEQKQNPELSWVILERYIGKPVFFVNDGDISSGWIIVKGLHIDETGHSVLGTDGTQLYSENCKFYRMEI